MLSMCNPRRRRSLRRISSIIPDTVLTSSIPTKTSSGWVRSLDVMRILQLACLREGIAGVRVRVHPQVAYDLLNRKRSVIVGLEQAAGREIRVLGDPQLGPDEIEVVGLDRRGRTVKVESTALLPPGAVPDVAVTTEVVPLDES